MLNHKVNQFYGLVNLARLFTKLKHKVNKFYDTTTLDMHILKESKTPSGGSRRCTFPLFHKSHLKIDLQGSFKNAHSGNQTPINTVGVYYDTTTLNMHILEGSPFVF